ncbi:MAG: Hpt domain-containing protein [Schwartzia sp.]|nr:Hpt domain-containing protein [Schwartzia sp. (in: firmicutes)]MBR1760184.1 Hpt domain-containing protein [Schwartzia sp. (in: firmicutes)]MBR1884913.1 Hpt domain-containing protein [Schwartzia sp. (in: firmicutes)]
MLTLEKMQELGIDPKEGLTRCMNNEVFFFKMIAMAVANEYFDTLGYSLEKKDFDSAFEAAHALKGVIGNLALKPIYDPLAEMTELLRAKKDADYVSMYRPIKEIRDQLLALTQD